jgi:hypothetical protein
MKIDFQFETKYGLFSDSLILPDDQTFTEDEILAMQQERLDAWIHIIENPEPGVFIPDEEGADVIELS